MNRRWYIILLLVGMVVLNNHSRADLLVLDTNHIVITNGTDIASQQNGTDFGILWNTSATHTFIVTNSGAGTLLLTNDPAVYFTGTNTNGFEIITWPNTAITGGMSSSFSVRYTPVAAGIRRLSLFIPYCDDSVTNIYTFVIQGEGASTNILTDTELGLPDLGNGTSCWGDFNGDGYPDLYFSGRNTNGLFAGIFQNINGLTFSNIQASIPANEAGDADWGDFDCDGDLDLACCGYTTNGQPASFVFRNDGSNTFTDVGADIAAVYSGAIRWGDYDADGLLDLALTGYHGVSSNVTFLYHNEGNGVFTNSNIAFPGLRDSLLAWGDYDSDGWPDLLISGDTGSEKLARIYRNNGTTLTNSGLNLPGVSFGDYQWVDFDNDGDLDLSVCGYGSSGALTRQYRYVSGASSFSRIDTNQLAACWLGNMSWSDFDNDGDPDMMLTGCSTNGSFISNLYKNDGSGGLQNLGLAFPGLKQSASSWADISSDGTMDLLLAGRTTNGTYSTHVYLNTALITNTPPTPPVGLRANVTNGYEVVFSWNAASDNQTPSPGLSYNIYVSTASNECTLVSALPVNTLKTLTVPLSRIPASTTIYWGVQAIDTCNAGSLFTQGCSFSRSPLSDFSVSDISYMPTPFSVQVTVTNESTVAGNAGLLAFWLNLPNTATNVDGVDKSYEVGLLQAGEGRVITFTNFPSVDTVVTNTMRAFINATNTTLEETLSNNQYTQMYETILFDAFRFYAFSSQDSNYLRWSDPVACGLETPLVHLRWATNDYPADLSAGIMLYQGTNRLYHHSSLTMGQPYYYTIWVSNDGTNFIIPPTIGAE